MLYRFRKKEKAKKDQSWEQSEQDQSGPKNLVKANMEWVWSSVHKGKHESWKQRICFKTAPKLSWEYLLYYIIIIIIIILMYTIPLPTNLQTHLTVLDTRIWKISREIKHLIIIVTCERCWIIFLPQWMKEWYWRGAKNVPFNLP
jgi:hypothetical protein